MHSIHDNDCSCGCVFITLLLFSWIYSICNFSGAPQIKGDFQAVEYGVHTFNYSNCIQPRLLLEQDADVMFENIDYTSNRRRELRGHSSGHSGHTSHSSSHSTGHSRAEMLAARTAHMRMTRDVAIRTAVYYTIVIGGTKRGFDRRTYILDYNRVCAHEKSVNQLIVNVSSVSMRHRAYVFLALRPTLPPDREDSIQDLGVA